MPTRNDDPPNYDDGGYESFCDAFDAFIAGSPALAAMMASESHLVPLTEWIWQRLCESYHAGRHAAMADAQYAADHQREKNEFARMAAEIIKYHRGESND